MLQLVRPARVLRAAAWRRLADLEGWLCPALLKYFPEAPKQLYVRIKSRVLPDAS